MSRKLSILLLGALLVLSQAAQAYIIMLKDGTRLTARDKPEIRDGKVFFYTEIGVFQQIPVAEFDSKRTEEVNAAGLGNAYVLGNAANYNPNTEVNFGKKTSLQEHMKKQKMNIGVFAEPTPDTRAAKASKDAREKSPLEKGLNEPVGPSLDPLLNDAFLRALEASGIRGPQLTSISRGVKITAVTDGEAQVFAAIGAVARAVKEARAKNLVVDRVDLKLTTSAGEPAGSFEMSPDDADALLNGKVAVAKYFVNSVIF